jgi:transcription antitermination factor NusG
MLARDSRSTQTQAANSLGQESIVTSTLSYSEALRNQRQQTKNTTLALKKLKYQFKNISSKILRSKTSQAAKQAAGQARREVLRLKRQKQSGNYDDEEIEAAINHAKAMERVAKKKAKHLEEEEMANLGIKQEDIVVDFEVGDTVTVLSGAWEGTVGMIQAINEQKQSLSINVELFGRETPVELNFSEVRKMD